MFHEGLLVEIVFDHFVSAADDGYGQGLRGHGQCGHSEERQNEYFYALE